MLTNKTQTQVSISGLTYNNLIQDAYNALKDSDEFKNNFTSFTSNSAERMIVELYAYVATQLANRMDQMGNELFVDTASISGLSRLMKLVGAKLDFPSAASVNASFNTPVSGNAIVLSSGINPSSTSTELSFSSGSSFYKVIDSNGNTWEAINTSINDSGEIVYEYGKQITYTPSTTLIQTLHEGITESQIYTINTTDTNIIRLTGSPVIKNSVRIYYKEKTDNTSDGIVELKKVDNFFTTDALTANNAVYTERNIGNGTCEIWIKPFISDSYTDLGKDLLIMYRVGGGEAGNISIGTIDVKNRIEIRQGTNNVISSYATMNITNITAGIGGRNELTTEEIRNSILQEVRNTKIAVTEEDYEYLLPKYDSAVMLVKCYGEKNDETANLAETYGYYTNPLNIWLLILKYNKTFSDAYMSDTPSLTDRINDIVFSVFDINPRFNEKYQINTASLNQLFVPDANKGFSEYFDVTDDNHVYRFPITEGVKTLGNKNCLITVTKSPYIEGRVGDKRGAGYFSSYDGEATPITWAELMALPSAEKDDVYIVTDKDSTGEVNDRWICTESYDFGEGQQIPNYSPTASYTPGTIVKFAANVGDPVLLYECDANCGISTYINDFWERKNADTDYDPDTSTYLIGQVVKYDGKAYECKQNYIIPSDYLRIYWTGIVDITNIQTFDADADYSEGSYVWYEDDIYKAKENIQGTGDAFNYNEWDKIEAESFSSYSDYQVGDYCEYNETLYICDVDCGPSVYINDDVYWESLGPIENFNPAKYYDVDEYVIYSNSIYKSKYLCGPSKYIEKYWSSLEGEGYWSLVNTPYIYNNIISEGTQPDIMYIQQGNEKTSFSTVYSYLPEAFSASWDSIVAAFGNGLGGVTFNNITVTFDGIAFQLNGTFNSIEDLCDFLNEKINPETNAVILKTDVSEINSTVVHSSNYVAAGSSSMLLKLDSGESFTEVAVSLTGVETYSALVNSINAALETAQLNNVYKAMLLPNSNDCYDLALISKFSFGYKDKNTEIGNNCAFYTNVLNHENPTFPLESSEVQVDVTEVNDAAGFIITGDGNPFVVDGDKIIVNSLGEETSFITDNTTLNDIFGVTANNSTVDAKRSLTVVYIENPNGSDSAYLSIDVGDKTDIIDWPFYINIFGTTSTQEIKLGSYYENIENNLSGVSSVILSLLKRGPIKNLYSTNYIIENGESQKDIYGSNYQLKFSTGTIQEQTFNELSSQNSPAEVITSTLGSSTLKNTWGDNDYLYMKVDNVESTKEISNLVTSENGYAKIRLKYFNGKTTTEFANTLVNIFTYTEDEGTKYLLNCVPSEDYRVRIYTTSSAYYSSINFGDTPSEVVYSLFGISDPIVQSKEGQVEATQISYKYLPITNNIAMGKSLKIEIWQSGSAGSPSFSDDVSIGYSIDAFKANIENAVHIKGHVILDNSRIIFTDLANGLEFKVIVEASTDADLNAWKLMFGSAWSMFNPVTGEAGKYECVFENAGDYYIEYREEDGGYYFHVENSSKFPYGDIYFHMYEDYTNDHIVSGGDDEDTAAVYTDEYIWNNLMTKKRVMLTEHIYKQPRFVTFDLDVVCLVHNTEQYSGVDYYNEVRKYLRTEYGLYSNNIGKEILPEDIIINIKSNFDKIFAVAVNYLGYDMLNSSTNRSSLETDFNQKHILASNKSVQRLIYHPEEKNYSLDTVMEHGLNLTIKFVNKREYN